MKRFQSVYLLVVGMIFIYGSANAGDHIRECMDLLAPMKKERDAFAEAGGIWSLFEVAPKLREHSSKAIQLESRVNELLENLTYLCETQNGVPYNELASFVTKSLELKGPAEFKKEQIFLGKTEKEVDSWLKFGEFALSHKDRTLDRDQINISIAGAEAIFAKYIELSRRITAAAAIPELEATLSLTQEIVQFETSDPYLAKALRENEQVPFWDIDENYGGS